MRQDAKMSWQQNVCWTNVLENLTWSSPYGIAIFFRVKIVYHYYPLGCSRSIKNVKKIPGIKEEKIGFFADDSPKI